MANDLCCSEMGSGIGKQNFPRVPLPQGQSARRGVTVDRYLMSCNGFHFFGDEIDCRNERFTSISEASPTNDISKSHGLFATRIT